MDDGISLSISGTTPDWRREKPRSFRNPSRKTPKAIRQYQDWHGVFALIVCKIGDGLNIPHPNGIVIHPIAEIGVNCLIHQQATIDTKSYGGTPTIKGHGDIGASVKILGGVSLQERALIGTNAVVTHDDQSFEVVTDIPASVAIKINPPTIKIYSIAYA